MVATHETFDFDQLSFAAQTKPNRAGGKYPLNAGNYTGAYAAQPRHASNRYAPAFDRGTHGNYGHGNYGGVKRSREFETGGWPPRGSGQ